MQTGNSGKKVTKDEEYFEADPDSVRKYRDARPVYTEGRERAVFEQQERKRADQQITGEIREHCRPEIEEYIDCTTGKFLGVVRCRDLSMRMRSCLKKYKLGIDIEERRAEIIREFENQGEVLDRALLARRNNLYVPPS